MLMVSYVSGMLFAVASAFSTTYVMFAVLRFFTGFCITGIVIVSSVLSNYILYFTNCCLRSLGYLMQAYGKSNKILFLFFLILILAIVDVFVLCRCGMGGHWAQETGGSDWQLILDIWKRSLCTYCLLCYWLAEANCERHLTFNLGHHHMEVWLIWPTTEAQLRVTA